jgi:pheophorbide a oxygenase
LSSKRSPRLSSKRFAKAHGEGKQIGPVSATIAPPRPSLNPEKGAEEENDDGESVGTRDVVEDENIQERPEKREEEAAFVWRENWYPVSLIEDLDSSVPTPFQLLGRELVVWKDQQGEWRVFEDKCPHRLAPLSVCISPSLSFPISGHLPNI